MTERVRIARISPAGIAHEETLTGDRLVFAVSGTTVVVRIHDSAGQVVRVASRTGVSAVDWWPDIEKKEDRS